LPFELPFGSFLNYSPRGQAEISARSKRIGLAIKADGAGPQAPEPMIEYALAGGTRPESRPHFPRAASDATSTAYWIRVHTALVCV
jgi:hypothetical protein